MPLDEKKHPVVQRAFLTSLFEAAVAAADPFAAIRAHLPTRPKGRTVIVGAGKASAVMARAFEQLWTAPLSGVVVARHGDETVCERISVLHAAHPVPDDAGLRASLALKAAVADLTEDDLVVALISGGGSALLPSPAAGLTLADEIAVNRALLASGLPISAMNVIRRHVSTIKGGQLAQLAYPARVFSLIVSDIPGDNPAHVASGPTVSDGSTRSDALALVRQHRLILPDAVMRHLEHAEDSTELLLNPGNEHHVIASARVSLEAAANAAQRQGVRAVILSDCIEGEARDIGKMHAAIAREVAARNRPFEAPVVLLSGGETTVTIRDERAGRGGRNSEFLLSFALDIAGENRIFALAADTDGIDGSEHNAGAFADGRTTVDMRGAGVDPVACLNAHDAFTAFQSTNALLITGQTGTNVNDFRAILIEGKEAALPLA